MEEKPRVMLYVNNVLEGGLMESIDEAKQKAVPHIQNGDTLRIEVARWKKPLETLTYTREFATWSSKVG